jgi:Putative Ig domain
VGKFRVLLTFGVIICTLFLPGCSGKSAITVTLSPSSTATINQGQTVTITATVANDSTNAGVTWSLASGGVGTLSGQTKTSVTYIAPSFVSTNTTVTVTATSVTNTSVTASVTVTINAVLAISTTSLPVGSIGTPYFGVISATGATGTFAWSLTSGSLPAGLTLSSSTTNAITISGTPSTLGTSKFTIQVTAGGTSVSQSLSITINPPPPLSVATKSLPNGIVGTPYSSTLQAASGLAPFTWSITTGTLPAGLSLSGAVISGTPTATGTSSFTVKVVDSTTPTPQTATGNLGITINPSLANDSKLNGTYAFLVGGFDPNGQFVAAGSLVADGNGNITSGVMDSSDPTGVQLQQKMTGAYFIDSTGLGTMTLNILGTGTHTFALALMANGNAKIIECDDNTCSTNGSGVLLKQDTTAFSTSAISGNYAFGFLGEDGQKKRYALAGEFHTTSSGNASGVLDSNDAGAIAASVAFTWTYSVPVVSPPAAPTGRGTASISTTTGTTNYSFYVVSATQLLVMETDHIAGVGTPLVSGMVLQQGNNQVFSNGSLNGASVFETTALPTVSGTPVAQGQVGILTTTGSGSLTLSADLNTGGAASSASSQCSPTACTYSVQTGGRVTLVNSGFQISDPVLYLVSQNQAFIVGTDPAVTFGFMESQSGPFTSASLSGTYAGGSIAPMLSSGANQLDIAVADGVTNLNPITTDSSTSSGLIQNSTTSATYSVAGDGRGAVTPTGAIFYMVSPTEFWSLSAGVDALLERFQQ